MARELPGFDSFEFEAGAISKPVYRRGEGPGVIVLHELPGMIPECVRLAEAIAAAGYSVYLPLFFGKPGQAPSFVSSTLKLCVSREFTLLRRGQKSPITDWLRALAGRVRGDTGGRSVGAIGLCLTGSFALAMLLDDSVVAPVVSEPGLPLVLPFVSTEATRADLGLSPEQLAGARQRVEHDKIPVLGFRFQDDTLCPRERFATLRREFGSHFQGHEVAGNRHCVLTLDFAHMTEADQERVWTALFTFLNDRLKAGHGTIPPRPGAPVKV